jgi:hypothetical protein
MQQHKSIKKKTEIVCPLQHVSEFYAILLMLCNIARWFKLKLWRRHKQHNQTERRAVEYCMYI